MSVRDVATCLWFDDDLEEALASWGRVFGDLRRVAPDQSDPKSGGLVAVRFELAGRRFVGLQGGPGPKHTEAMSLYVLVEGGQGEIDRIWDGFLAEGAEESMCGWLTDRFGISWQIVPVELEEIMTAPGPGSRTAAWDALMGMRRIVIAELIAAG